jgi:hypothetical protein
LVGYLIGVAVEADDVEEFDFALGFGLVVLARFCLFKQLQQEYLLVRPQLRRRNAILQVHELADAATLKLVLLQQRGLAKPTVQVFA